MMIVPKKRASLLDRFKPYLSERIDSGCLNASVLHPADRISRQADVHRGPAARPG